ncbi:hypothetical protein KFE25_010946 [Diacronema lutheri]|uniref:SET domain-containing protein n=1 Tax=Diacronema lutheri TaxID=2081491 RepID=A0A8J5XAR2_DIALT|nr:hypothetical protein KFE25_010946 [Diacronema lutheri]
MSDRVRVWLSVQPDARVRVGVAPRACAPSPGKQLKRRSSQNRQLEVLRDFLGKGSRDTAANRMWASCEEDRCAVRNMREGKAYGCRCNGVRVKNAPELWCGACERFFHVACERLDVSAAELHKLRETYLCTQCERAQLEAAGVDLLAPAACTVYECRFCARVFTTERGITIHAARCSARPEERTWSCRCNGSKSQARGVQCAACTNFFHRKCRAEARPSWEAESEASAAGEDTLCEACARVRCEETAGGTDLLGRRAARPIACAQQMVKDDCGLSFASAVEFGTLANRRVFVAQSTLGACAGLGLFAAQPFEAGEFVTAYSGNLLYKAEVEASKGVDQSYMLRIPGSGGQLIDGGPFALALRANPSNPQPGSGHWQPLDGAPEWHLGAASMANDPRRTAMYNSRLVFKCPKGGHRDVAQLVPMRAYLCATQRIEAGSEILYNYGSDKPFHALPAAAEQLHGQGARGGQKRKRAFRVLLVDAQPPACQLPAAERDEAAEREAARQRQLDARSARAHARNLKVLDALVSADALGDGLRAGPPPHAP